MIRKIIAYILIGLGIIIVAFFRYYHGTIFQNSTLFYVLGFALLFFGFYLSAPASKEKKLPKVSQKEIDNLKENGEKIKVELSKCEIKSNDYSKEQLVSGNDEDSYTSTSVALNLLTGNEIENVETVDIYQSMLIFNHNFMNRTETFISKIVPNEHTALLFKLDKQKTTFIYVDRQDRTKYYFDLEFLAV